MKLLSNDYNRTTGLYLVISTLWLLLGVAIRVVNEIQMVTFMPGPDSYFSYGYLRPIGANLLIFGGVLGYFFALGYQIINERASFRVARQTTVKHRDLARLHGCVPPTRPGSGIPMA